MVSTPNILSSKPPSPSPSKFSLGATANTAATIAGGVVELGGSVANKISNVIINPFTVADDVISKNIIGIHDSQAPRHDVSSLYNVVTNIVKSSTHIGDSLDLKRGKPIELVEDKVPDNGFIPSYSTLKEIACQMTCKPFNAANAHESVVGILEKLKSYSWDAKAVIALTAFALDYGETWRLSLTKASKENALELHVFRFAEEEKPPSQQQNADLIATLVDRTIQLIDGIIWLERKIADTTYGPKEVPTLYKTPRDLYTYWAILALLASATQMTGLDWNIKSEVVGRLKIVLTQLQADHEKIEAEMRDHEDLIWRFKALQSPTGIVELLRALIFPKDTKQLDIIDNSTQLLVDLEVLKTKNLLLFISGLDNIEDEIWALKPIYESFRKDKDKQDYNILWVPVVEKWNKEEKEKYEHMNSLMPWYVVEYFSLVKGFKPLQEVWNYQGKPIVVVADARGEVKNKNALHMIFVWGIKAFPFREGDDEALSLHWNWFWTELIKISPEIEQWLARENKYVFVYGGTDIKWTQTFGSLLDSIKRDPILKQTDTFIEQFNISKIDPKTESKFWVNITNSFLSKIQKNNFQLDSVLKEIQTLLSLKNEKGWAILSKGENVLVLGYNELMMNVLEGFEFWKNNVLELQGFDIAFKDYYDQVSSSVPLHCLHFELNNIRSGVPMTIYCPEQSCGMKMEIESVNYKCCHGMHYDHAATQNGEAHTPVLKRGSR
ncbi:hypothetical protein PIB30_032113 [Stylosanthes scabra]|uniref:Uncharacterized protein n=1 Tax=Stylosanthes scabra TaxID=79078 RepID=A0ABU6UFB7_9FABA|nr:hypothetical protein [Stylosanthes scabra]